MDNAGSRFQRTFADEPLLERLRILARDDMVDSEVRQKCNLLFRQWAAAYKSTPGLERIAQLHKQLPKSQKRIQPHQSRVVRENDAEASRDESLEQDSPFGDSSSGRRPSVPPTTSSSSSSRPISLASTRDAPLPSSSLFKRDKKGKLKPFNLEKEKQKMLEAIASATVASNNLANALKLVNRERELVSQNPEVIKRFEACKSIRRQILRYIQLVESEQYIGSLLNANDVLVDALISFEIMDKSIEDDSDSDTEAYGAYEAHKAEFQRRVGGQQETEEALAGLKLSEQPAAPAKPPRPMSIPMPPKNVQDELEPADDADDPFGDQYAAKTPHQEKDGLTW
jgi:LAS seventeen-binding protein 5